MKMGLHKLVHTTKKESRVEDKCARTQDIYIAREISMPYKEGNNSSTPWLTSYFPQNHANLSTRYVES